MPTDYRRFNGPENSVSYKRYLREHTQNFNQQYRQLFNENGARKDGRTLDISRSIYGRTEMVPRAKGSSYLEMRKTKVVCSVFDPREIPHQNEYSYLGNIFCEVKFAPFSCPRRRRPYVPDAEEKALSVALKKALEPAVCRHLFPNYQIDIFVYILENDGACLAAAIIAAGMALADAAVPMYDVITASSVAVIGDNLFVDPCEEEEYLALKTPKEGLNYSGNNHGVVTMSMLYGMSQIANFNVVGAIDTEQIINIMAILQKECRSLVPLIQKILVSGVAKNHEVKKQLDKEAKERDELLNAKIEQWKRSIKS